MIKPVNNGVFIEPLIDEKIGSIFLARETTHRHLPHKGIVRAIADDAKAAGKPLEFKVGDTVIFDRHHQNYDNGLPAWDGNKITIVNADDVWAILGK